MKKAHQKMTEATAEMLSEWLNQMWETMHNDPIISELLSAMKMGSQSVIGAGIDAYRVLGLDKSASEEEVKTRYRELIKKLHPDTSGTEGTSLFFQMVLAAYQVIKAERRWQQVYERQ
jgi:DnaJ-domain-containing protein 1